MVRKKEEKAKQKAEAKAKKDALNVKEERRI